MGWWLAAWLLLLQAIYHNDEGRKALEAQNYRKAVEEFTKAAEADPKDYTALFHLAFSYSMLDQDGEAIPRYRKVLELKPGLYQAELNLAIILIREKQPRDATPLLEAAAREKPKEYRPAYYLAEALFAQSEFQKAEAQYRAALDINPAAGPAHLGLARALVKLDRLDEAARDYRKAAELDPQLKSYLLELASLYESRKQTADAIAIYQQFPDDPGAREHLGQLLLDSGRAADAIPQLERAVAVSPTTANRVALAQAYLKAQQPDKALPLLAAVVRSEPADLDIRMIYGRALRDQRKFAPAAEQFLATVKIKPDYVAGWNELSAMLISLEDYPQALAALDRVKALGGETPGHLYLRAIVLDKTRQLKEALAAYESFLASSKGDHPDEEFKARQRARIIKNELSKR